MSTPRTGAPADRLQALLEPAVTAAGYDLEAVRVSQVARRRRVEVTVDGDQGVSLDAVSELTRVVSDVLDGPEGAEVMGEQPYLLEVSSPGTDRPLTLPKHWRRAKGRLVHCVLRDGGDVTGRVLDGDEEGVLLEVVLPAKKGQTPQTRERRLAYSEIAKAKVEIEFSRKDDETGDLADDDGDDIEELEELEELDGLDGLDDEGDDIDEADKAGGVDQAEEG